MEGAVSNKGYKGKDETFAKGGGQLGRSRNFLKESDGKDQRGFGKIPDSGFVNPDGNANDYSNKSERGDIPATRKDKTLKTIKPRS